MLVIVALLFVLMVGMVGLAIDGGRAYVERRVQQNAADAAALGAADKYWADVKGNPANNATGVSDAFTVALQEFSYEESLDPTAWSPSGTFSAPSTACQQGQATASATYTQAGHTLTLNAIPVSQATIEQGLCVFNATSNDTIPSMFIQVLNGVVNLPVGVTASALSGHAETIPTLLVLDQDCSNNAQDWKANGNSGTTITGSAWSDGNIFDQVSGTNVTVNSGAVFDHCDAAVPSEIVTNPAGQTHGHAGILPDPLAGSKWATSVFKTACTSTTPNTNGTGSAGTWSAGTSTCTLTTSSTDAARIGAKPPNSSLDSVELKPGLYTAGSGPTGAGCWFLAPGIYEWNNSAPAGSFQMTAHNEVLSNELVPPGAQNASTNLYPVVNGVAGESPQFDWNDSAETCRGGLRLYTGTCTPVATCGIPTGTYFFRVTSARKDFTTSTGGNWRESYMSNTATSLGATTTTNGCIGPIPIVAGQTLQLGISNVPGMGNPGDTTQYNVYVSKTVSATCPADSTFGYLLSASGAGIIQTVDSLACPSLPASVSPGTGSVAACGLNYMATAVINGSTPGIGTAPWPAACYNNLLNVSPWTAGSGCKPDYLNPATSGDTANEDYCVTTSGTQAFCSVSPLGTAGNPGTPGGVLFYFPSTSNDIAQSNGAPYVYGSLAIRSVDLYAQAGGAGATITGADKSGGTALNDAQFIGQVYMPTELLTIVGGGAPIDGAIVVFDLNTDGSATTTLTGRFPSIQITVPGHIITCTTTSPATSYCPNP